MPKPRVAVMLELHWPYKRHADVFVGTQQYAREHGWESTVDEYAADTLRSRKPVAAYDGIIARATEDLVRRAARLRIPLVNVWTSSPARARVPGVYPDFAAIGRMRAEHLLARGFRRFAALVPLDDRGLDLELEAFAGTTGAAGFPCIVDRIPLAPQSTLKRWRRTERTIVRWMDSLEPPIGVYVGADGDGRMVAQMCRNRGWRIPEDVAIVAGWNEETICEHLHPTLTSVEVGYPRIGYEAAKLLDRMMRGGRAPRRPILLPPQGLVVRESTDFYAVDDPTIAAALQFIAARSHLDIGPDDVALAVAGETRTLQRRFRKHLGRPIAREIRRVRIERAKRELTQGALSLKQIARKVGFGDPMRMYEVFRRELGITPSRYRQQRWSDGASDSRPHPPL
jgi:LacI family transcriptional regulator